MLNVRELKAILDRLDDNDRIGYYDGDGGCISASTVEFTRDPHATECDCGCVAIALV